MGRHTGVCGAATSSLLMLLLLLTMAVLPQSTALAQSRSASIVSLNTDKVNYYSGEMVTIALVVRNAGDSAQILSNITIVNPSGTQVYAYSRKYDIASGATSNYEFYWTIPYNAVTGIYQVQATIADGKDGRFYSSRETNFVRNNPAQSPRAASLLELSVDRDTYLPGQVSTIVVFMQNTGGTDISVITAVDVVNPSGAQVFTGIKESNIGRGYTDKVGFALPIPDNASSGTYQVQATIADKIDGKLYGSKSATMYVQPTASASVVVNKPATPPPAIQLPNLGISGWGQYLITGLLIALAAIVIFILIRNRPRSKEVISGAHLPESTFEEEKPEDPL